MKEINYKSETIKLSQSLNKKELAMWQSLSDMYRVFGTNTKEIRISLSYLRKTMHLKTETEFDIEKMMDKLLFVGVFPENPMNFSGLVSGHLVSGSKVEFVSETGKRYVYYYIEKVFNPDLLYENEKSCTNCTIACQLLTWGK